MKTFSLVVLCFGILFFSCDRKEQTSVKKDYSLGIYDSLVSEVLDEKRKVIVYLPPAAQLVGTNDKFPVLYLLDGDAHFPSVAGLIHQLSSVNNNTRVPEMIVVAIPNTDRRRDLTPTHFAPANGQSNTSGGGENFTEFIESELIPFIEKKYPVSGYRTLVGHSLGGLLVVNTAMKHTELFTNYLAIDPSLWWDDRKLLNESKEIFKTKDFNGKSLYVAIANTKPEGMTLPQLQNDTSANTTHIRSIFEFCVNLNDHPAKGLAFDSKYYDADDHSSVPLISTHDALRSFFNWYRIDDMDAYFDKASDSTAASLVRAINAHYAKVSNRFGYEVKPSKQLVKNLAYNLQSSGLIEKSEAMFRMNAENYPEDHETHEALGDFYQNQKDSAKAIAAWKRALTVTDKKSIQEKIDNLKKSK